MDTSSSSSSGHPVSELVDALLEAVQAVVASPDASVAENLPAEFMYELDQVVSNYLDENQISMEQYDSIQQDVVNSLAHQLLVDSAYTDLVLPFDHQGNAGLMDVVELLDHHLAIDDYSASPIDHGFDFYGA